MSEKEVNKKEDLKEELLYVTQLKFFLELQRNPFSWIREISNIIFFEFKRIIFTPKFFIALSLVLLPAIIYLDSIAREVNVILLDFGVEVFVTKSASGYIILGQFLTQLIAIMLTLDSFGKNTNDSMQRYYSLPVRRTSIYFAHTFTICLGSLITAIIGILIFNLILWIWTGVSLTFVLIMKALFLTFLGALLAIATTTLFIVIANYFNFESSIAIIPTLFLFYIIPFLFSFVAQFLTQIGGYYNYTFMYQLTVIADFMIKPLNGLHNILTLHNLRIAWLVVTLVILFSEIIAAYIFNFTEK